MAIKKKAPAEKAVANKVRVKKTPAKAPAAPEASPSPAPASSDSIRIRMYRQGLGDCFLLTFGPDTHVLIDCGVLAGAPGGVDQIKKVAQLVKDDCKGHLRALVATHEHWDHVSGFSDAKAVFEQITIDEVWVAWTEDPTQTIAQEGKKAKSMRLAALGAAVERLAGSRDPADWTHAGEIAETFGFLGGSGGVLGAFSEKTNEAMNWVTDSQRKPKYWSPGDIITRPWLPGIQVHVLGPPKDKEALKNMDGDAKTDLYGMSALSSGELGMASALCPDPDSPWAPFDSGLGWTDERDWLNNFDAGYQKSYRAESWRRVDTDWLSGASDMALQLDNAVNNTSLVLAIELTASKKVLLFVGDAQIGNWKSWVEKAQPLLEQTVFYKVGHHGSHNATLKEHGLEEMASHDLVAMIPVDEKFAKGKKPIPWMMPADKLYQVLQEKTRGRILRVDKDWPSAGAAKPDGLSDSEWKQFTEASHVDPMFIDFVVQA